MLETSNYVTSSIAPMLAILRPVGVKK